jgi:hypothetical protein
VRDAGVPVLEDQVIQRRHVVVEVAHAFRIREIDMEMIAQEKNPRSFRNAGLS